MVSFSCEACGDILTKKKLDPHRNQCRGASFTCIDCMVHFQGTEYRSHTTCMTEAQKYEGALYKDKPAKGQRKGKNGKNEHMPDPKPNGTQHRAPYVEDAPDVDDPKAMQTPGDAANGNANGASFNVFDFMEPNNASKISLAEPKGPMRMMDNARSMFDPNVALTPVRKGGEEENVHDTAFKEQGFTYGAGPIHPSRYPIQNNASMEFVTPAPKKKKDRTRRANGTISEKKRKRRTEDVDMDDAGSGVQDTPMMDAPSSVQNHPGTPLVHSGLTGGLDRMMRSPSVEGEEQTKTRRQYKDPVSPIKHTRRNDKENAHHEPGVKTRAERFVSSMFGGSVVSNSSADTQQPKAIVRNRRRSSSDNVDHHPSQVEVRRHKKTHKVRSPSNNQVIYTETSKPKRKTSSTTKSANDDYRVKQIDAPHGGGDDARDMVVYGQPNIPTDAQRDMAAHFLSLVTKGPESSRGFSMNKILKRFHNNSGEYEGREQRAEDEKELWRTLRLKRNERGEIVVFF